MPVTAKLSKLFYDRLGDAVANELVDWFNAVDATYRADLRELNELNFARFDAKLDQRVAELHAKLDAKIDRLAAELNGKIDRVAAELNGKIDRVSGELNGKIDRVSGELNGKIDLMSAELKATLERRLGEQTRWLFLTWASLLIPIIGLWIRG
jgi:DNA anti-recombination protein RmuC